MLLRHCSRWLPIVVLTIGGLSRVEAQGDTSAVLKAAVRADWTSLQAEVRTASWESHSEAKSAKDARGHTPSRTDRTRFAYVRDKGSLWVDDHDNIDGQEKSMTYQIGIANEHYMVTIRRPVPEREGWLIKKVDPRDPRTVFDVRSDHCFPWMRIGNVPLLDCLADPCFHFDRIEPLPGQGHRVRAHFTCDRSKGKPATMPEFLQSGFVDLDPSHHHKPTAYQYREANPRVTIDCDGVMEYRNDSGIPLLRSEAKSSKAVSSVKGTIHGRETTTYKNVKYNEAVDDSEFWLSHYGLPEPVGVERVKPTPAYVWLLVAAGGSGIVAVFFRWLARRRAGPARASAAPS